MFDNILPDPDARQVPTDDHRRAHLRAHPPLPEATGPLLGLRVVDLTHALAGPFCTMLLGDLGADVLKVELPEGDMSRKLPPFAPEDATHHFGGYFASVNRNKRSVVLDWKGADRDVLLELVDRADVFVENHRAGLLDDAGLSYETLAARNPRLVYCAIRGFGDPRTGESPYVEWPAFDVVAQAMSSAMSTTGTAIGETVRVGPSIGDLYPATLAAFGVTAAVLHARVTGQGQFVDVAMYDALVALCESNVYRWSYTGAVTQPEGDRHPHFAPFEMFDTKDGRCAVAAPAARQWATLCEAMGRLDLIDDERTRTNGRRLKNRGLVRTVVGGWTATLTTAELVGQLGGRIPIGPLHRSPDLFEDEHLRARRMLVALEHPGIDRPMVFPDTPLHFTATPAGAHRRAPLLGEHTSEVLEELRSARAGATA